MLWASYYDQRDSAYSDGYESDSDSVVGDDYDNFSLSSRSREKTYSATMQNYAKGRIPAMLHHRLSELFSVSKVRHILGTPDILTDLRRWSVSNLSAHEIYTRKDKAIHSATENLCSLLKIKDPSFCSNNRTLIERIVTGTFHNMKSVVLDQLLQLIQSTLKEEGTKLTTLKKKVVAIKQQEPTRKRKLLENRERVREEERRLDIKIRKLSDKKDKDKYDAEALADLKEQKSLLMIEPEHVRHDLEKQAQVFERISKQKHVIQADIQKFTTMSQELSDIVKERESSADLEDAWNEINTYFEKLEKAKQEDMRREEKKARELADEKAKEETQEKQEQTQEMQMLQDLGGKSADPEASKESASWLSSISKLISVGGK